MMEINEIPEENLPAWMKLAMRGTDWGILIVIAIACLSAWVFVTSQDLPAAPLYESYVWEVEELAQNIQVGNIYPRWSYWIANGYGAPLYHYTPPGASYSSAVITAIFTGDAVQGIRVFIILTLCLGAGTTYSFLMRMTHAQVGMVGAMLYLFNPFISSTLLLQIGDLDLLLVSALLPTLLWASHRFFSTQTMRDLMLMTVVGSMLMLTSPLWCGFGILAGIAIIFTLPFDHSRPSNLLRLAYSWVLILCITAFFWIPALVEIDLVTWVPSIRQLRLEELHIASIIRLPRAIDTALLFPEVKPTLGIWLPLLSGIVLLVSHNLAKKNFVRFWGLVAVLSIGFALWYNEHDILIISVLGFSLVGSHLSTWTPQFSITKQQLLKRIITTSIVILTIVFGQSSWVISPRTQPTLTPSSETYIREIVTGSGEIMNAPGHAIPLTTDPNLTPARELVQEYLNGQNSHIASNRDNGMVMSLIGNRGSHQRYQFRTTTDNNILTQNAYFEGWQARVNGRPIIIEKDDGTGLIRLQLPQTTNGDLELSLETNTVRLTSWLLALGTMLILLVRVWRQRHQSIAHVIEREKYLDRPQLRLILSGLFAIVLLIAIPMAFNIEGHFPQTTDNVSLVNARPINYRTDAGLMVVAYEIESTLVAQGDTLGVRLWWQIVRPLTDNLRVQIILRNASDNTLQIHSEIRHPAQYPTRRWARNIKALDAYQLTLEDDLPAGRYTLSVRVVECIDNCAITRPFTFFDNNGTSLGTQFTLPQIITHAG